MVVKECTQWIKVVDENDEPIEAANVIFDNENVELTSHDGRVFTSLEEGSHHIVKIWKEGYECEDFERSFVACTGRKRIIFYIKKIN